MNEVIYDLIGIYKITNLINKKSYIGQSLDIHRRWRREIDDSNNPNSHSYDYPLMRAFRKYGIDNFNFEIIEECDIENLNEREMYWINFYDTFFNGYNQTLGGDSTLRQPKEKIIGIIVDLINTDMSHRDIALKWDISMEMVQGINTGRYWKHNADYPLQKKKNTKIYYCNKCGKVISRGSYMCSKCYKDSRKSTISSCNNEPDKETLIKNLYDNNGNFTKVAAIYQVSPTSVRRWCIKYGISNKSSDYKEINIEEKVKKYKKIGVIQLDKDTNEEISRFDSISSAIKSLNLSGKCSSHITDVCRDIRKTAYGYKWKFA